MIKKKIQKILFGSLVILSLSSAIYLNGQAKVLESQGFEISYFSSEDAEELLPDVEFVDIMFRRFISNF